MQYNDKVYNINNIIEENVKEDIIEYLNEDDNKKDNK